MAFNGIKGASLGDLGQAAPVTGTTQQCHGNGQEALVDHSLAHQTQDHNDSSYKLSCVSIPIGGDTHTGGWPDYK